MNDDGRVTGLCPTVDSYVLAARDGENEPTCLICGEAVEPIFSGTNGGNTTNGLEGDGPNRKPSIQPEHDDVEFRKPYDVYGNGAVAQAIDCITDERILRLHFDGIETPFYVDHRRTDHGFRYARGGVRFDSSPAQIGYGIAKAVFYEFVPLEESLFVNAGGDA